MSGRDKCELRCPVSLCQQFVPLQVYENFPHTLGRTTPLTSEQASPSTLFRMLRDRTVDLLAEFNSQDLANVVNGMVRFEERMARGCPGRQEDRANGSVDGSPERIGGGSCATGGGPRERIGATWSSSNIAGRETACFAAGSPLSSETVVLPDAPHTTAADPATAQSDVHDIPISQQSYRFSSDESFLQQLSRSLSRKDLKFEPQHLANLVWAFGRKLQRFDLIADIKKPIADAKFPERRPQELVNIWTVFAEHSPSFAAESLVGKMKNAVHSLSPFDLVATVEGCARVEAATRTGARATAGGEQVQATASQAAQRNAVRDLINGVGKRCLDLFGKLDEWQKVFVYVALAKLADDGGATAKLAEKFLSGVAGAASSQQQQEGVREMSPNQLSLLLNASTLRLKADVFPFKGSLVGGSSSSNSSSSKTTVQQLLDLSETIIAYFASGKWMESSEIALARDARGSFFLYPLPHPQLRKLLLSSGGDINLGLIVYNVAQSLQFMSDGYSSSDQQNMLSYLRHPLRSRLIQNLTALTVEDHQLFSSSQLLHAIYALLQIWAAESSGGGATGPHSASLIPLSQRDRLLERLSSAVAVEALRPGEVVACVNCLALTQHLDTGWEFYRLFYPPLITRGGKIDIHGENRAMWCVPRLTVVMGGGGWVVQKRAGKIFLHT